MRFQLSDEFCIIAVIIGGFSRKSRRAHARPASQRLDTNSRIIRQRGQPGRACRMTRFGQRVFDKGDVRLLGLTHPERCLRDDFKIKHCHQRGKFAQLAGIGGGDNDFIHGTIISRVADRFGRKVALR